MFASSFWHVDRVSSPPHDDSGAETGQCVRPEAYDERFAKRYGYWRQVTDEVCEKYLQCGDPHFGFARIRCEECGAEYLRPFSCKCRGFCPILLEEEVIRPRDLP
ncbi:MAG: transposase zinc-binding domain-containing protein [Candidatus Sabulitectum sp.]|nr:transposase zinc-binding domain-containing protein [Candidatus Sabulitectum sp.]